MSTDLRPLQHLRAAMRDYPRLPEMVDNFRRSRGRDLPGWPDWCFVPMAGVCKIVRDQLGAAALEQANEIARVAALAAWRYSQGVYRLDPDLQAALIDSPAAGNIPAGVLHRLPEWCVYVETPGLSSCEEPLHGFFAHLDCGSGGAELRLLLDLDSGLLPQPLHLGEWTLSEAVAQFAAQASALAAPYGVEESSVADYQREITDECSRLLSLLLYLCSAEPEVDDLRQPGHSPARARPTKTKRGWRLFPPDRPTVWTVGEKTGEQLRAALRREEGDGSATGHSVRAHLRRGHWHGYWTGPRSDEHGQALRQKFIYRWLHPLIAGGHDEEETT